MNIKVNKPLAVVTMIDLIMADVPSIHTEAWNQWSQSGLVRTWIEEDGFPGSEIMAEPCHAPASLLPWEDYPDGLSPEEYHEAMMRSY